MPPRKKRRKIRFKPNIEWFKPARIPIANLDKEILKMDEFEAIRLVDVQQLKQKEAAKRMDVSQATLSRILSKAREKIGKALVNGNALRIENPSSKGYQLVRRKFQCLECKHTWQQPFGEGRPLQCPKADCHSKRIHRLPEQH